MTYPAITSESEIFNTSDLESIENGFRIIGNDTIHIQKGHNSYVERDNLGNLLKSFSKPIGNDGTISGFDYSVNPVIGTYKEFFENGNLKLKGLYCWFGFKIGLWFYYDNNGALISSVDNNIGFSYGSDDVINYCETHNIPLKKSDSGHRTTIYKKIIDGRYIWIIRYPNFEDQKYVVLELDGDDGTVIKTSETIFPLD